jgi:hypothetical protein
MIPPARRQPENVGPAAPQVAKARARRRNQQSRQPCKTENEYENDENESEGASGREGGSATKGFVNKFV